MGEFDEVEGNKNKQNGIILCTNNLLKGRLRKHSHQLHKGLEINLVKEMKDAYNKSVIIA